MKRFSEIPQGQDLRVKKEENKQYRCPICQDHGFYFKGDIAYPCRCSKENALNTTAKTISRQAAMGAATRITRLNGITVFFFSGSADIRAMTDEVKSSPSFGLRSRSVSFINFAFSYSRQQFSHSERCRKNALLTSSDAELSSILSIQPSKSSHLNFIRFFPFLSFSLF